MCRPARAVRRPRRRAVASLCLGSAADQLPDRYIVVFRPEVGDPGGLTDRLIQGYGGQVHFRYAHALRGFAATLPPRALDGIRRDPNVAYVEEDQIAYAIGDDATPGSWGLDRVDERDLPLDGNYHWDTDGSGVTAYIIDTGILTAHTEFGGRASVGYDAIGDGRNGQDCNGHGTHVSGTVGGAEYGIAKNARLVAVRVLNCQGSGSYSQVIAGVDWVTGHAQRPAVANMSLGGGFSSALNNAVTNSVAAGVTYAVAAGNDAFDACYYSPASTPAALTVGATEINDARAWFSNVGTCLDVFAPGSGIKSAWHTSTTATFTASGTSMASPHVAGVAALYLAFDPTASPAQVEGALESQATPGVVTGAGAGSPNLLLYSRVTGGGSPPPPPPPPPPPGGEIVVHSGDLDGIGQRITKRSWRATGWRRLTQEQTVLPSSAGLL